MLVAAAVAAARPQPFLFQEVPTPRETAGAGLTEPAMPDRYLHVSLIEARLLAGAGLCGHVLRVDYQAGRFRIGTSLAEVHWVYLYAGAGVFAPLYCGYELYARPRRTAFFYSMVPSVHVEAMFGFISYDWSPVARLSLVCNLDYYGLGIGLEAGAVTLVPEGAYEQPQYSREYRLYAGVKLRALTASFGL